MKELEIGSGDKVIQYLHANAYPPECYKSSADLLSAEEYKVVFPYQRPLWPGADAKELTSWNVLVDDIIAHMDKLGRKGVIGMGHSMGGIATWLAALKRPDLFSQIVLIDPVILPKKLVLFNRYMPFWFKKRYVPIVKIASNRRDTWKDREELDKHLGSKKVFQRFEKESWQQFLKYGVRESEEGVTLTYPRSWEARVYSSAPNIWSTLGNSSVPTTIIKAEFSDVIFAETWVKIQKAMPEATYIEMAKVGHLIPFEAPKKLSEQVLEVLR